MNQVLQESLEQWIHERVRQEVRAQLRRMAMARTREDFINRLVEVLMPALSHYYRAMLGSLNGRTDQLAKWQEHEESFIDQFRDRLFERAKAKGLDRKKAAKRALEELLDQDAAHRRGELAKFQNTYKLKKPVTLPEDASAGFIAKIRVMLDELLPNEKRVQP